MGTKEETDSKIYIERRERYFRKMQITFDMIDALPEKQEIFIARVLTADQDMKTFTEIQDKLTRYQVTLGTDLTVEATSEAYEELYFHVLATYSTIAETQRAERTALNLTANNDANEAKILRPKLPPIIIPKFSGDIEKFPAFKSLFDTLVHDTQLSAVQKFSFLKSYVEHPALSIFENLDLNDQNYPIAYKRLTDRYTDKRLVGTHYLNKILQFKPLSNGSSDSLRQFLDTFSVLCESLNGLGIPNLADFILFHMGLKILDPETRRSFEDKSMGKEFPTLQDPVVFVNDQYRVSSMLRSTSTSKSTITKSNASFEHRRGGSTNVVTKSFISKSQDDKPHYSAVGTRCPLCEADHRLLTCEKFNSMNPSARFDTIRSHSLCYACFGPHARSKCTSKFTCRVCQARGHHTLLHRSSVPNETKPPSATIPSGFNPNLPPPKTSTTTLNCQVNSNIDSQPTRGLLGTVQCRIRNNGGDWVSCRMVVDPASESSFITESLVQTLCLPRRRYPVNVVGVGSSTFANNRGVVECKLAPCTQEVPNLSVKAIILSNISSKLPTAPLDKNIREKFRNMRLADPNFDVPGSVDLLLGVQHYSEILADQVAHVKGEPAALDSIFGFIIFGKLPSPPPSQPIQTTTHSMFTHTPSLDSIICKFWENEEIPSVTDTNPETVQCEKLHSETTTRDTYGRYVVSLPFKGGTPPSDLGSTRSIARKRFISLERKLMRDLTLQSQYNTNLQGYCDQDHIRPAKCPSDYLMTHHAVIKPSSTTNVRVVFNGSEKSDTGKSLNQFLMAGPKLQTDISQILLLFRTQPIALTADLKQMFRRIRLLDEDSKYTHFLWRPKDTLPITEWEFTTLPFGLTCSPYLAQRTLKQLVADEGSPYPLASRILSTNIYVDDIVCSVSSDQEAITLYNELKGLLAQGGFTLHKFSSNSSQVLSYIPTDHHDTPVSFDDSDYVKLLGLYWNPSTDEFCYKFIPEEPINTKRGILSQVARIYDISGYLTPVTFWIKYLIQRLWLAKLDWDDPLPKPILTAWSKFYSQLPHQTTLRIPRYISYANATSFTLIGFCDASESGYAACLYLRVESSHQPVRINLLKARSRVSPLKTLTIPRLELNGALLLANLLNSVKDFVSQFPSCNIVCYTDSTIVLSWLRTPTHLLKTYVSNRTTQILEHVPLSSWHHISGTENPADVASRGCYPDQLLSSDTWLSGPSFLLTPPGKWPVGQGSMVEPIPESKPEILSLISKTDNCTSTWEPLESLLNRCSGLPRLKRILAYVLRFIFNARKQKEKTVERKIGVLTYEETSRALKTLVGWTQKTYYQEEFASLSRNERVKVPLRHLTPFMDPDGFLRVGGRLISAPIPESSRHPYLLPRKSRLAELICQEYHDHTLHGGPLLIQSLIQRHYWIPGLRYLLRTIIFKCIKCYRFKAKPLEPLMSAVPSCRFGSSRAFANTGVDLAGPYSLKESKRRNARHYKGWIVLFICLSTRAVYIDIVSELTTVTFLASFDRFISRRGVPSLMMSDLGTNFVGASRELREIVTILQQQSNAIQKYCEERHIVWKFNPPAAPNFGGSWESAIKSMKHHLRRVLVDQTLTYEELSTLLAKIEAILNSRPLCPISSSPTDGFDYLTPGHFLVGAPLLMSRPEVDQVDQRFNYNARWNNITRIAQHFWRRWSHEYIHTLMQRSKWDTPIPNLSEGQLVLISDNNRLPNLWSLGRIIAVHLGSDGVARVAKLKTPSGYITRPVNKLCTLPFVD